MKIIAMFGGMPGIELETAFVWGYLTKPKFGKRNFKFTSLILLLG
jgi:hypothetical protein